MVFDDLFADGEADARPGQFPSMQTFEQHENVIEIFRIDADAIVADADDVFRALFC